MTVRNALVLVSGVLKELPAGDTLAGTGGGSSLAMVQVSGTTQTGAAGNHYAMNNAAQSTFTVPATISPGDEFAVTFTNLRTDNIVLSNGLPIRGTVRDVNPVNFAGTLRFKAINATYGLEVFA